jgi:hypothetical protein
MQSRKSSGNSAPAMNVTFNSPALSGSIQCTPYTDTSVILHNYLENQKKNVTAGSWFSPYGFPLIGYPELFISNFTIAWAYVDHLRPNYSGPVFDQTPQIQAINCFPNFEKANARITVSVPVGNVLESELLDTPVNATEAWDDSFSVHFYNASDYASYLSSWSPDKVRYNQTVRYEFTCYTHLYELL